MNSDIQTKAIGARIGRELASMERFLGDSADADAFLSLENWAQSTLERIGDLEAQDRRHAGAARTRLSRQSLRLGVFPTAGNPIHWGHLLAGLAAIQRFHLDKVIYLVAGDDPRKPGLVPERVRHRIAQEVLEIFRPLLEYSPLALGTAKPGEENVFNLFEDSRGQPLHVFYLAGSDHFRRFAARSGSPDTIQRLETGVRKRFNGFDPRIHRLSAVFLDRGDRLERVETFLDVGWIERLPLRTSSTVIRGALGGLESMCELAALPFTCYCAICANGVYRMEQEEGGREIVEAGRDV